MREETRRGMGAEDVAPEGAIEKALAALEVGDLFRHRRTFTEADSALFVGISGDWNPYHTDAEWVAATRFGKPIVPGLLVASMTTHVGGLLGFLAAEMQFKFRRPVYPGDTVALEAKVVAKDVAKRQVTLVCELRCKGEIVVEATARGIPTHVRLRAN